MTDYNCRGQDGATLGRWWRLAENTIERCPVQLQFIGEIWFWRGPAPWYFVTVPGDQSQAIKAISGMVTYGWGCIPVRARIGSTEYTTSLFPRDGLYAVPVKASVRKAERLDEGDIVAMWLQVG